MNISKLFLSSLILLGLLFTGCADLFKQDFKVVIQEVDKFSTRTGKEIRTFNNRLSTKSICGGIHIDSKGLYINGVFFTDNNYNNEVILIAEHYNWVSTEYSSCTKVGYQPIREIIFLADGRRIAVNMKYEESDVNFNHYNTITRSIDGKFSEASSGKISLQNLILIANANILDVKIVGGKNSQTFDNDELEKDFKTNLQQFITEIKKIKKHK